MASNINPYNIDGTFPVAGQDNSSQGFRDNFTNIKNNFNYAENEITDLQNKALLTSALNGQTINNDMAGTVIKRPQLSAWTQSLIDKGSILTGTTTYLDFNSGNFQKITTSGSAGTIGIQFINWPTSTGTNALGYGVMRVWIDVVDAGHTITLPATVTVGIADIAGHSMNSDSTHTITFDQPGNYIFDFSSVDGGADYQIFDLSRNRASFRDPLFYFNTETVPTLMVGYDGGLAAALELEQGQDIISALGSINTVAIGNLSQGNIKYNAIDTGNLGGYGITAARGNIALGTIANVQQGDYLGYIDVVACVNADAIGTTNQLDAFTQLATINFWNTGSNYGGNVGIFTAPNGGALNNQLNQAVGIENDQSVKFFGDVTIAGNINTTGRHVDTSFTVRSFVSDPLSGSTYTVPNTISTVYIDNDGLHANLSYGNIILPAQPVNGQVVKLVFLSNITKTTTTGGANIFPSPIGSHTIKYLPGTYPNIAGNTSMTLTFASSGNVWYRS